VFERTHILVGRIVEDWDMPEFVAEDIGEGFEDVVVLDEDDGA
jgi:hypothetical protein